MSDDTISIVELAQMSLKQYYDPLEKFYYKVFHEQDFDSIVFIVRRSFALAEIFRAVFKASGENVFPAEEHFTTDSMILTRCNHYAEILCRTGIMPRILIIDELSIQGNVLNELVESIEEQIIQYVQNLQKSTEISDSGYCSDIREWTKESIQSRITERIELRVFARNSQILLLNSRYEFKFSAEEIMAPKEWYDFSNCVASLVINSGVSNASFVMGFRVSEKDGAALIEKTPTGFEKIEMPPIETNPCGGNVTETVFLYSSSETRSAAPYFVPTIRLIRCTNYLHGQLKPVYLIMPFIFLPALDESASQTLRRRIEKQWCGPDAELTDSLFCGLWPNDSRTAYEAVSFYLSTCLLYSFLRGGNLQNLWKEPLETDELRFFDEYKIKINYRMEEQKSSFNSLLQNIQKNPSETLFSPEALLENLQAATVGAEPLFPAVFSNDIAKPSEKTALDCRLEMENIIANFKLLELADSLQKQNVYRSLHDSKTVLNYNFSLSAFVEELSNDFQSSFTLLNTSVSMLICNLLQFMDSGIATLKIRAVQPNMKQFRQSLRMGEQSLFILPKRYYEYLPVLALMEIHLAQEGGTLQEEIANWIHYEAEHDEEKSKFTPQLQNELIRFVEQLHQTGQCAEDWDIDLVLDIPYMEENSEEFQAFLASFARDRKRQRYVRDYMTHGITVS